MVERLADIQIQQVRVNFSPGQLNQLKVFATKNNISIEEAVRRVVVAMQDGFFDYVAV